MPICIKCVTCPDGRDFVGYGIQPDVFCERTIKGFLAGRDEILEKAWKYSKRRSPLEAKNSLL